jgi:microcystin-dependent protein
MADEILAEIRLFAGDFAPVGWAFCNGQVIPIRQYTALFSLLGTTYGGDGRTTFALPNLQGRVAVGTGQGNGLSFYDWGQQGGSETTVLTINNLPAHSHNITGVITQPGTATAGNTDTPYNSYPAMQTGSATYNNAKDAGSTIPMQHNLALGNSGNNSPVGIHIIQPVLALNWIISIAGDFPLRQ